MGLVLATFMALAVLSCLGGKWVHCEVYHVVGGDRGWEPSTDLAAWTSGREFRVGDKIWFAYSAGEESIAELRSKEEYESCDATNPIKMFIDGLNSVLLDGEGIRYFVSSRNDNCKNGLKLHVEVLPEATPVTQNVAAAPTTPSKSVIQDVATTVAAGPTTPSNSVIQDVSTTVAAAPTTPSNSVIHDVSTSVAAAPTTPSNSVIHDVAKTVAAAPTTPPTPSSKTWPQL